MLSPTTRRSVQFLSRGPSRAPSSSSSGACSIYVHDEDPASATMPTPRTTSDPSPTSPTRPSHVSFPGKPSGVPSQGALLGDNTRRGTRTTGGRDDDVPDMHAGTQAGPPPSVPLVVQLVGTAERGSRRGGGRFATSSGVSLPSPRSSSPSRRSRFATEASTLPVLPPEPFVSFGAPVSPRGSPKRRLLESLERSEPSSCPVSPRASLLPPALDDPPSLSRCNPRRSTLAAPFVPPPWPEEVPSHGAAPARPRSPAVKVSRTTSGTGGTSPSRPPSSGGKGAQRGLSDEDFEKLVSSFRGGAKVAPEASKAALEKVPPPTLRSRGREQKGGSGQHEHAAGVKGDAVGAPSCPCARPWKGFLLSGGDADVDAGNDAKSERRWGRLVRTCGEGDAFGELELLGGKPQPR